MFIFCSNGSNTKSDILSKVNPLVQSWEKATSNDQNFFNYVKVNQHDDGWGSYQYYINNANNEHFSIQKSSIPAFNEKQFVNISEENFNNYILLRHARKASPSMPITLSQNHPFVNETGTIVLAHNGTLDKEVLRNLLQEKLTTIDNLSDTQILNLLLKERFGTETTADTINLFETWKELLFQIKQQHKEKNLNYSMNFIFILKNTTTKNFYVFYSTVYSNPASKEYLNFYFGKSNNNFLISSSTIIDYFNKDSHQQAKSLNLAILPNNTVGLVSLQNLEIKQEQI